MHELKEWGRQMLTVRKDQMVFAIPSSEQGVDEIVYVDDESIDASSREPINLGGAWATLVEDGDALLEAIERDGRNSPPSPPITVID